MNVFFHSLILILVSLSEICKFIVDDIKSGLIKYRYRYHKTYRILIITIAGVFIIGLIIASFAFIFSKYIHSDYWNLFYSSATLYLSGNEQGLVCHESMRYIVIIEQLISLLFNNILLAVITYNLFKTYNNIFLSRNLYILEQEGNPDCFVLRFRIADINNEFANFSYSMQFFNWYENKFKDTHYTIKNDIPELDYIYNEDICLFLTNKHKINKDINICTDSHIVNKNIKAIEKILSASDNVFYAHNSICITLTATSTKTSESIIVRRYYGKKDIKFVEHCKDVYTWDPRKKDNKSPLMWHHVDEFILMEETKKKKVMAKILNKPE